jgi:hypothetical protein
VWLVWFEFRHLWFPKDPSLPGDYEDALAVSQSRRTIAIADGVSTAIFSRRWAELVTTKAILEPISFTGDLDADSDRLSIWLEDLQKTWRSDVKPNSLPWHQQPKAVSIGGQTTLLFASLSECEDQEDEHAHEAGQLRSKLRVDAIGDCNLFLIREGQKILSFPIQTSEAFSEPPNIISSIARPGATADQFKSLDTLCSKDDLLVFCSDAVGLWATRLYEHGEEVDWMKFWGNPTAWQDEIYTGRLRLPSDPMRMRVDDCTLVMARLVNESPEQMAADIFPMEAASGFEILIDLKEDDQEVEASRCLTEVTEKEPNDTSEQQYESGQLNDATQSKSNDDSESNLSDKVRQKNSTIVLDETNSLAASEVCQTGSDKSGCEESEADCLIVGAEDSSRETLIQNLSKDTSTKNKLKSIVKQIFTRKWKR